MIEITYNSVNITDGVSVNKVYHDMYAEGRTDTLNILFNDNDHVWDGWGVSKDDKISVSFDSIKTGVMFVHKATPKNGLFEIVATSAPSSSRKRKSKAWRKIRLLGIGKEIADNHGLKFESYGVEDVHYEYILQQNESDFAFLHRRCILEGCAFLVYDEKLVMYSQRYIEGLTAGESIYIGSDSDYEYEDKSGQLFSSCTVERGAFKGSYEADNGAYKDFIPSFDFSVNSNEEAGRFAKNLLRMANKNAYTGYVYSNILVGYAAASMAKLENERAPSWNGNVFLTHVRNDYGKGLSKIWFRRPLEGGY